MKQAKGKLVFSDSKGNLLQRNRMRDKMHKICKKVGILKATVHDLRHTFASGPELSSKTKQEIGGWSSKQVMEETYNNPPENIIRYEYFRASFIPKVKDQRHANVTKGGRRCSNPMII
ncbi:MAG: tyrosine-type recombinase/integrase [Candidatus Saelkia tenebricola]|nr:tyrosine-type recombinase/integrase [Candidatus Saelkia tenebricola]